MRVKKCSKAKAIAVSLPLSIVLVIGVSYSAKADLLGNLLGSGGSGGGGLLSGLGSLFGGGSSSGLADLFGIGATASGDGTFGLGGFNVGDLLGSVNDITTNPTLGDLGNLSSTFGTSDPSGLEGLFTTTTGTDGVLGTGIDSSTIQKIQQSGSYAKSIFGDISSGNWGGALQGATGLLGALGVINPQAAANQPWSELPGGFSGSTGSSGAGDSSVSGSSGSNPFSPSLADDINNAKTPLEVYELSRKGQSSVRQGVNDISQLVLSDQGQQLLDSRAKESATAVEVAGQAASAQSKYIEDSTKLNASSQKATTASAEAAKACVGAKESLACLKQISQQNAAQSVGLTILSGQSILQSAAAFQTGNQLKAVAAIEKINGDHLQLMQVEAAGQTMQLAEISSNLDRNHVYQLDQDRGTVVAAEVSSNSTLFPGFAPSASP